MINIKALRDENNRISKNLNFENQKIYTDIVCYLRVSNLSEMEQEEVFSDILRMFFDCQNQGKEVKKMIGEDYKQFTDDIILALNPKKNYLKKIKLYAFILFNALFYVLTIDFFVLYLPKILKGNLSFVYNYSLDMALRSFLILVIMLALFDYVGKNSFKLSRIHPPNFILFLVGCSLGCIIIVSFLLYETLSDIILVSINIRFIIVIITVFWIYKVARRIVFQKQQNA